MSPMLMGDGYLLLGSSETTLDLPADLAALWRREQLGRVQVHRRADAPATAATIPAASSAPGVVQPLTMTGA
jgi:chemotaxis protein methyltransferase CheR